MCLERSLWGRRLQGRYKFPLFSTEENGKLRINIWVAYREDLWSKQNLNKMHPGVYAIVREPEEFIAENAESQ